MTTYQNITGNLNVDTENLNVIDGNLTANVITGNYFVGDGQFLTGVTAVANIGVANILANGTSNVSIPVTGGNVNTSVGGVANVLIITSDGAYVTTTTPAVSVNTGAFQVSGGAGVAGNFYAGAIYSNNQSVLTNNTTIYGGTY